MMFKLMLELEFTTSPDGWCVGGRVVDYARLMLSQLQLKLELKFKLSLAIIALNLNLPRFMHTFSSYEHFRRLGNILF